MSITEMTSGTQGLQLRTYRDQKPLLAFVRGLFCQGREDKVKGTIWKDNVRHGCWSLEGRMMGRTASVQEGEACTCQSGSSVVLKWCRMD